MTRQKMFAWCAAALAAALLAGCASVSGSVSGGQTPATAAPGTVTPAPSASPGASGSSGFWPTSLSMTSATSGWALYDAQNPAGGSSQLTLLATTVDGARSWTEVTPAAARPMLATNSPTEALDPVDGEHAYLAVNGDTQGDSTTPSPAAVFATADGGKTWTESAPFSVDGPVVQVTFANARDGWLLVDAVSAPGGTALPWLYRTTDGGLRWMVAATGAPPGEGSSNNMCNLLGIAFPTATTGWVHVSCRSGDYLARSTDGGSTWAVQSVPALGDCSSQFLQCTLFGPQLSDGSAFVTVAPINGATSPSLTASGDLGQSWQQLPLPAEAGQYPQVKFFSRADGVLVTMGSQEALGAVFYTTTDGGQTWIPVAQGSHFTQPGATVEFTTPQDGFSWNQAAYTQASTSPPLYATTNSGLTWVSFTPDVTG